MSMTMNAQIEMTIKEMMDKHTQTIVKALSVKYDFDLAEAMAALEVGGKAPKKGKSKAEKPAKGKKATSDDEKPKKGANSFLLWSKEKRAEVKAENPEMTGREVTKELGRIWREEVEEEEKEEWKAKASGSEAEDSAEEM